MQTSAQERLFDEPEPEWVIGIDESGTGAWAGPFHVAGVLAPVGWKVDGVNDSKKLTDERRRELEPQIRTSATAFHVVEVPVRHISGDGQRPCWRRAVTKVLRFLEGEVPAGAVYRIIIDGSVERRLARELLHDDVKRPLGIDFIRKADRDFQHVGAASILAKTARNDAMLRLCEEHPHYGWDVNTGYPTGEHARAVVKHGTTKYHRNIDARKLARLLEKAEKAESVTSGAEIVGPYRYRLWRQWAEGDRVVFVMLNPSTADATEDDATIRKCIGFAKRWGYTGIEVVNLYALRSTDPQALYEAEGPDVIGPKNDDVIFRAARNGALVVAAWGMHGGNDVRDGAVTGRAAHVRKLLYGAGTPMKCLGLTKGNHQPRHPLMLSYSTPLEPLTRE